MSAQRNSAPGYLKCDACGGMLVETARVDHPRLPAHEIRTYDCRVCGAQEQFGAPTPFPKAKS